jgi:DNA-binding CsgD family transcriptional regulator
MMRHAPAAPILAAEMVWWMDEASDLSRLVGGIYDAALDPERWPDVLNGAAAFVGGVASALFMKDTAHQHHNVAHTFGYDPEYTRRYVEHYVALDPFTVGQLASRVGDVISLADLVRPDEFVRSRFYLEWVRPQGWIDALGGTLEKTATRYAAVSVIRHERNGMVDDLARRRMTLIVPHVRRAVLVGRVIDLHKIEAAGLADALDGLATAMFLVDSSGHIIHANRAGHAMQAAGDAIAASRERLSATDAGADQTLREIVLNAESGDAAVGTRGIAVPMTGLSGERYIAHVLPLTSGARRKAGIAYSAVAAVFVRKATLDQPYPLEALAAVYRLTPAELRVVVAIVQAAGVPETAAALGVSGPTVRTHLQRIFDKTGAKRQADLVKLVAGYMSPLGGAQRPA